MPAKRKPIYYRRKFLNLEGFNTSAHVLAQIDGARSYPTFRITDCDRMIELQFDVGSDAERRNALHKADLLAEITAGFRDALREHAEEQKQQDRARRQTRPLGR